MPVAVGTFSLESPPPIPRSFHNRPEPREGETLTPLEELARRLEKARIPVIEEAEPRHAFEPSIVSDTFASILVAQGAYAEALKAYQTLARTKPERTANKSIGISASQKLGSTMKTLSPYDQRLSTGHNKCTP